MNDTVSAAQSAVWPRKTRELQNHHLDSTNWNGLRYRDGDIVIATYSKAGTTWMQQIVGQLIFGGAPDVAVQEISPWLDVRLIPKEALHAQLEAQTHRRFMKTHLPVDALGLEPRARYIYIARDGRDVAWSCYRHQINVNEVWYSLVNDTPGRVGPPFERPDPDVRRYFNEWLARNGHPFWPFWENVRSWWAARRLPNVKLVHFSALKKDMASEIRRIARFLDIRIDEARFPAMVEHSGFDYMRANAPRVTPGGGAFFENGGAAFFDKGANGRWRDVLTPEDGHLYERMAIQELGPDCAHWLKTGEMRE
jgi:aryl sulfotransferase